MPESSPLVVTLESGRHAICRCGNTMNAPFCDGSHQGTESTPEIVDVDADVPFMWCRCRQSGDIPRCDGSHAEVG